MQDPTNPENGIIEVRFWKEIAPFITLNSPPIYIDPMPPYQKWPSYPKQDIAYCYHQAQSTDAVSNFMSSIPCASNGATVEGTSSHQTFSTANFAGKDGEATVVRLTLVGNGEPVIVQTTRVIFCGKCGRKNKFSHNNCFRCGTRLPKDVLIEA